jgi:hypothetical protein
MPRSADTPLRWLPEIFNPSTQAIKISFTPRFCNSMSTCSQNFAPSVCAGCTMQSCRAALNYVPWKLRKPAAADLQLIFRAATVAEAEQQLQELESKGRRIPPSARCGGEIGADHAVFPLPAGHPQSDLHHPQKQNRAVYTKELTHLPNPTPFSARCRRSRRIDTTIPIPLTRCLSTPGAVVRALLAPKPAPHFKPRVELSPQPHANYHHTNHACPLANATPSSQSLSHHPNTIQFA